MGGRGESGYVPVHAARKVGFGEVAALRVVEAAVGLDAAQVRGHDVLAFAWNAVSGRTALGRDASGQW
jgi:hypothetical protein